MFRACLLIPVYNHGPLIEATLARLAPFGLPCLLVDDGSEAATAAVLDAVAARNPAVRLFRLPRNSGKGAAVLHGIGQARQLGYTHAVQVDADGQHAVEDLPALLALAQAEPTALISGRPVYDRSVPKSRLYGRYLTHALVWLETWSFDLIDSMCGFRVYPVAASDALARRQRIGARMDFDTDIMVRLYRAGTPVRFLPTRVTYPENGISHFRLWRDNARMAWLHIRLLAGLPLYGLARLWRRTRRSRQRHWSDMQERGSYWSLRLALACYRLTGRRGLQALLYPIIGYFYLTSPRARRASRDFLNRVHRHGGALDHPPREADVFRHLFSFGEAIVDRLACWHGDLQREDDTFPDYPKLRALADAGQGAVILTSHLGNAEISRAFSNLAGTCRMTVLMFTGQANRINRLMRDVNPHATLTVLPITEINPATAVLLQEKIASGEMVIIAADRSSPGATDRVSRVDFLGSPANFPQGPFILAGLLRCPVYLLFCFKENGRHRVLFEPFADSLRLPRRERQAALDAMAQRYAARLEQHALRQPLQWFNFYDFWAEAATPSATDRSSPADDAHA